MLSLQQAKPGQDQQQPELQGDPELAERFEIHAQSIAQPIRYTGFQEPSIERKPMKKPKQRKPHNLNALLERQVLLYGLRDFRYGQLLSPNESDELAQEIGSQDLKGWTLRSVLGSDEVDWFRDMRDSQLLITARTITPHRHLVVLSLQLHGVQFRWAIPLWELGARDWLAQMAKERCIKWVLQSVESDEGAIQFIHSIDDDTAQILAQLLADAATIQEDPQSSFHNMVQAGLLVMVDEPEVYGTGDEPTEDIRIFMMARQQNAHDIVMLFHRVSDDAQVEMGQCLTNFLAGAG